MLIQKSYFIQKSFQPILLLEDYRSFQGLPSLNFDFDFFFKAVRRLFLTAGFLLFQTFLFILFFYYFSSLPCGDNAICIPERHAAWCRCKSGWTEDKKTGKCISKCDGMIFE